MSAVKKKVHLMMRKILITLFILATLQVGAQPFIEEIKAFRRSDSVVQPLKGKILFVGSSTFTYWKDFGMYFPGYPIINRGFGGSTLLDVIRYADEVIINYAPKQIFVYCENDLAVDMQLPGDSVYARFRRLSEYVRLKLKPNVEICFISLKPSVARWNMQDRFQRANQLIREYVEGQRNMRYLDLHTPMLGADGMVRKDIFVQDGLHMNAIGYRIWQRVLMPYLRRDL